MHVESLELKNFRNYERISLAFAPGTNVLYGDNAQGKTNLLEAIHVCGTTKSHKGVHDAEMIRFGEEESHIRMSVRKGGAAHRIDMHLKKNKAKGVAVDGLPIRRASELFGMINIVLFSPEDLHIIKNGPRERRKFMDSELCQLDRFYFSRLASYNRIIQQRNRLLKDLPMYGDGGSVLDVLDEQLLLYGGDLIRLRRDFIVRINEIAGPVHSRLTDGKERLVLQYEPSVTDENFADELRRSRERDLRMRLSSVGPHRDDFCVMVNGTDMRHYGSQGQQRSAALSLKLSEISLVRSIVHESPVLLLDDVLSELDGSRQKMLLQSVDGVQTFITCTGMDELVENRFPIDRMFHIVQGTVQTARE